MKDLKEAYSYVPIYQQFFTQFIRFCFKGMHYQIRVMPFELAIVPKVFTTLKAVIGYSLRFYRLHIHIHGRMVNNQVLTSSFIYALNKNTTEPASHLGPFSKLAKVSTDAN